MKIDGRLMVSLMMLAIFVFFVGQALAFRPEARTMPLLVGVPAIFLCILQIVLDLHRRSPKSIVPVGEWPLIAWLAAFFAGILTFGFAYGAPLLVAAYLYFAARERLAVAIAGGVFCALMLSFGFEKLLNLQLFEGLITPLLLR
jgi:hypothetical protein